MFHAGDVCGQYTVETQVKNVYFRSFVEHLSESFSKARCVEHTNHVEHGKSCSILSNRVQSGVDRVATFVNKLIPLEIMNTIDYRSR